MRPSVYYSPQTMRVWAQRGGKSLIVDEFVRRENLQGRPVVMFTGDGWHTLRMDDPCDEFDHARIRPDQPPIDGSVWHRGWEVGYDYQAGYWTGRFWRAYRGGVDLDAPEVSGRTYQECLDEIDNEEDGL